MLGVVGELGAEAACEWTAGTCARFGTTLVAPCGGLREHAVVGELMSAWRRKARLGSSRSDESQRRLGVVAKRIRRPGAP